MKTSIRVLIADDEAIVRDGLRAIIELEDDLEVIGEAANGAEAVAAARELEPDVALVDIQMPQMDGVEATRRLLALPNPPRVLVLTTFTRRLIEQFCRQPSATGGTPAALASLTPRELEVLTLVAHGLSNTEIAAQFVVGETTVKTHVARILQKLGLRDRAQAVIAAYESGLVQPGPATQS